MGALSDWQAGTSGKLQASMLRHQLVTIVMNEIDERSEGIKIKFTDDTNIGRKGSCEEDTRRLCMGG